MHCMFRTPREGPQCYLMSRSGARLLGSVPASCAPDISTCEAPHTANNSAPLIVCSMHVLY